MIRVRIASKGTTARRIAPVLREAVARAVAEGAEDLRQAARDLIAEQAGGEPSAPGEPPRSDSGRLRDSLFVHTSRDGLSAEVGTGLAYGRHLEFGTQNMAARPWLHPALESTKRRIKERIAAAVRHAVSKGDRP